MYLHYCQYVSSHPILFRLGHVGVLLSLWRTSGELKITTPVAFAFGKAMMSSTKVLTVSCGRELPGISVKMPRCLASGFKSRERRTENRRIKQTDKQIWWQEFVQQHYEFLDRNYCRSILSKHNQTTNLDHRSSSRSFVVCCCYLDCWLKRFSHSYSFPFASDHRCGTQELLDTFVARTPSVSN